MAARLTNFTLGEAKACDKAFEFYAQQEGMTNEEEIDAKVWRDMQQQFPRLQKFWGIRKKRPIKKGVRWSLKPKSQK